MVAGTCAELIDTIDSLTPARRVARLAEVELEMRRLEAEAAVLVRAVERDRGFRTDGHLSVGGFLRAELRWSPQQVTARKRLATLVTEVPAVIEHLHAGTIGIAQANAFGAAAANPRCGGQLVDHADVLLESARTLGFDQFHTAIATWERLADADGADREAAGHHDRRRFDLSFFDGVGYVFGHGGALDYTEFAEIVEQYRHAEWLADWEDAKRTYGEDVAASMLARTDAQRSWDALMRLARDAVSTPAGAQPPEPVVNLCITAQHAEAALARLGLIPDATATAGSPAQPPLPDQPADTWRCGTTDGRPLSPFEVVQAMLHGRIRRVVFDSAGVVTDFGRLQRLFTGAARQAVLMQFPTCIFPGCNRPASHCDADHLTDWQHGGTTNQDNGGPMCNRHNLLKNKGFTVWRDPNGVFHTYRPDGTEIAPAPPPPGSSPPTIPKAA